MQVGIDKSVLDIGRAHNSTLDAVHVILIVLACVVAFMVAVFLAISLLVPWYNVDIGDDDSDIYYWWFGYFDVQTPDDSEVYTYRRYEDIDDSDSIRGFYAAVFAFILIAFCLVSVTIVLYCFIIPPIQSFRIGEKEIKAMDYTHHGFAIFRLVMEIIVCVICIIAFILIFTIWLVFFAHAEALDDSSFCDGNGGTNPATDKWCDTWAGEDSENGVDYYWAPYVGWAFALIAMVYLCLMGICTLAAILIDLANYGSFSFNLKLKNGSEYDVD